jgi:hypothetical protein
MQPDRKKSNALLILLGAGSICLFCGYLGFSALWLMNISPGATYLLKADGDKLFVLEVFSKKEFSIFDGKPSRIRVSIGSSDQIEIDDGEFIHHRNIGRVLYAFWSSRHDAAFMVNQPYGSNLDKCELWRWTRKGQFEQIAFFDHRIDSLHESLDGSTVFGSYYNSQWRNCSL